MSNGTAKPIRFSTHAHQQVGRRGCTEAEVIETIRNDAATPARGNRLQADKVFPFSGSWNGQSGYTQKRVRVIYVENDTEIVVVTVYCFFF